jgi:hypothetical protein
MIQTSGTIADHELVPISAAKRQVKKLNPTRKIPAENRCSSGELPIK